MTHDSYDSPWKQVMDHFFEPAVAFFFPKIHEAVDWSCDVEAMDTDLEQVLQDAKFGQMRVDKLVKVRMKTGKTRYLYIHIEVQNQKEPRFARRVFHYYFRLVEKYEHHVTTCVILGDENPNWRPDEFSENLLGTAITFRYPTMKLWDYLEEWEELEANSNPFALVVMTHLKSKKTRKNPGKRLQEKLYLWKEMRRRGYSKENTLNLMRFIGWVMAMPEPYEKQFWVETKKMEPGQEAESMWYIEKVLIEKGKKEGLREGIREGEKSGEKKEAKNMLYKLIAKKFGSVPRWVEEKIGTAEIEQLRTWVMQAPFADHLDETFS